MKTTNAEAVLHYSEVPAGRYSTVFGDVGRCVFSRRTDGRDLYHITRTAARGMLRPPAPLAQVSGPVLIRFTAGPHLSGYRDGGDLAHRLWTKAENGIRDLKGSGATANEVIRFLARESLQLEVNDEFAVIDLRMSWDPINRGETSSP